MERFNHKKLNLVESKEKYHVEVSSKSTALEDLDTGVDINSAWKMIREIITISAKETKKSKSMKLRKRINSR
jgi:hypothetical protein